MAARVRAPELRGGEWINSAPLSLADVRGKVVLLDFWTYCCINCLRVAEELRRIEARFPDEVVVVGVHSPKFPREHDRRAVAEAVLRHRIDHPVLDDPELRLWRQYGVKGWPTVVVIDPEGYVVGGVSGEEIEPVVVGAIEKAVAEHEAKGTLVRGPAPEVSGAAVSGVLAFPGKVVADGERRLAIADTSHDRVMVTDLGGRLEWAVTGLRQPQGVRFDGDDLVICDTGADRVIRARRMRDGDGVVEVVELATGLASPWDVVATPDGGWLVAEAGRHRLWKLAVGADPERVAGTGHEALEDGPALDGALAQPSGLARLPGGYAVVDSESSALRVLTDDRRLATLVGHGLFDWGSDDGDRESARLQHPLGVATDATGAIVVADTFNCRLREWRDGTLTTLPVEGLSEPGGVDVLPDGRLVVADTNHHRIVTVDRATGIAVSVAVDDTWTDSETGAPVEIDPGQPLVLDYAVDVDAAALDSSAGHPVRVVVEADPPALLAEGPRRWDLSGPAGTVEVRSGAAGTGTLVIDVVASACVDAHCTLHRARRRHALTVGAGPKVTG